MRNPRHSLCSPPPFRSFRRRRILTICRSEARSSCGVMAFLCVVATELGCNDVFLECFSKKSIPVMFRVDNPALACDAGRETFASASAEYRFRQSPCASSSADRHGRLDRLRRCFCRGVFPFGAGCFHVVIQFRYGPDPPPRLPEINGTGAKCLSQLQTIWFQSLFIVFCRGVRRFRGGASASLLVRSVPKYRGGEFSNSIMIVAFSSLFLMSAKNVFRRSLNFRNG